MRSRWFLPITATVLVVGVGSAIAGHIGTVNPTAVPAGYLATHNDVANIRIDSFARAVKHGRADVFIRHFVFDAGAQPTGWHTHPGPAIVTVVSGTFAYQDARGGKCRTRWYSAGQGFFDPGFGHVHRGIPGPGGAHLYTLWLTPSGTPNDTISAPKPEPCP